MDIRTVFSARGNRPGEGTPESAQTEETSFPGQQRRKTLSILCLLLFLLFPALSAGSGLREKKLTLMIYMCGSNLESEYGSASSDVLEMIEAGFQEQEISLLVMTGGSRKWNLGYNPDEAAIVEIGKGKQRTIRHLGARNMGEKETLKEFLQFCAENRPSEKYALIFWDHGGGPLEGVCWDEQHNRDHLTIREMREALAESRFAKQKLAWIGFDACLMSTVEVAGQLAPFAEYMIASQAEEPAGGWNYAFLKELHQDRNGAETGKRVADLYLETAQEGNPDLTMACIRLKDVAEIGRRMDGMFGNIADSLTPDQFSSLAKLRFGATGFGKSPEPQPGTDGYDLVDLISLTRSYESINPEAAAEIRAALEQAVVYSRSNLEDCCGLSVYHPYRNQHGFSEGWQEAYPSVSQSPGYTAYVNAYGRIMAGERLVRWTGLNRISRKEGAPGTVLCTLSREQTANLASARLLILARDEYDYTDESYFRVYSSADVTLIENNSGEAELSAAYHGESLQVIHGKYAFPVTSAISYRISENGTYLVDLYPHDEEGRVSQWPVIGEYERDPGNGELKLKGFLVYDEMTESWSQRARVDWNQYKGIYFISEYRNPTKNAEGEQLDFESWQTDVHTDTHKAQRSHLPGTDFRLSFSLEAREEKSLYAAYELTDTQGNTYMTELLPLPDEEERTYHGTLTQPETAPGYGCYLMRSGGRIIYVFLLQNNSGHDEEYFLDVLEINRVRLWDPAEKYYRIENLTNPEAGCCIHPGDIAVFTQDLGPDDGSEGEVRPEKISGTYHARPYGDEHSLFSWSFASEGTPDLPEEEDVLAAFPTFQPAAGGFPLEWNPSAVLHESSLSEAFGTRITLQFMIENHSDREVLCGLTLTRVNGRETKGETSEWSLNGGGEVYGSSWRHYDGTEIVPEAHGILPGGTGSIIIDLKMSEFLETVGPDVSLRDWECMMTVVEKKENRLEVYDHFPLITRLQEPLPLDSFYPDAEKLPPAEITEAGDREAGDPREIFSLNGIRLSLLRMYRMEEGKMLMLMRGENESEQSCVMMAENAEVNGKPAKIGRSENYLQYVLSNQKKLYGLEEDERPQEFFGSLSLDAGESRNWYVTVDPEKENPEETETVSFVAVLVRNEAETDLIWNAHTVIQLPPSRTGSAGQTEAVSMNELSVSAEQISLIDGEGRMLAEDVCWKNREELRPLTLSFQRSDLIGAGIADKPGNGSAETGEASAFYAVFRRIRGGAGLAELNILNEGELAANQDWLALQYIGMMEPTDPAKPQSGFLAVFPGLQLALRTGREGKEGFGLAMCLISGEEENTYSIHPVKAKILFFHKGWPLSSKGLRQIQVRCNPETGNAEIVSCEGADISYPGWSDFAGQSMYLLPGDADDAEIALFVEDMISGREGAFRSRCKESSTVQRIVDRRIRFSLEPLENPEEYEVVFYQAEAGEQGYYSRRIPLTNFLP